VSSEPVLTKGSYCAVLTPSTCIATPNTSANNSGRGVAPGRPALWDTAAADVGGTSAPHAGVDMSLVTQLQQTLAAVPGVHLTAAPAACATPPTKLATTDITTAATTAAAVNAVTVAASLPTVSSCVLDWPVTVSSAATLPCHNATDALERNTYVESVYSLHSFRPRSISLARLHRPHHTFPIHGRRC
jgi:hypothetical protein